jgi:hypothetical protein
MAEFCISTGLSPDQFWELTLDEYSAFVDVLNRRK